MSDIKKLSCPVCLRELNAHDGRYVYGKRSRGFVIWVGFRCPDCSFGILVVPTDLEKYELYQDDADNKWNAGVDEYNECRWDCLTEQLAAA